MKTRVVAVVAVALLLASTAARALSGPWFNDRAIKRLLAEGQGGVLVRVFGLKVGMKENATEAAVVDSIKQGTKKKRLGDTLVYAMRLPDGEEVEMRWLRTSSWANVFLVVGPPGSYIVTRTIHGYGWHNTVSSHRLFGKVTVEAGKVAYAGDLVWVDDRGRDRVWCAAISDPTDAKRELAKGFAAVGDALVESRTTFEETCVSY